MSDGEKAIQIEEQEDKEQKPSIGPNKDFIMFGEFKR